VETTPEEPTSAAATGALIHEIVGTVAFEKAWLDAGALAVIADNDAATVARNAHVLRRLRGLVESREPTRRT